MTTCKNCGQEITSHATSEGWLEWVHVESEVVNEAFCDDGRGVAEPPDSAEGQP